MKAQKTTIDAKFTCVAVLVVVSIVAGCASFDDSRQSLPRLKNENQFESSKSLKDVAVIPANWPNTKWWERYGDTQLDQLVSEALTDSPSLRIAKARVDQSIAFSGIAEAAKNPQLTGNVNNTWERFSANSVIPKPFAGTWDSFNETTLKLSYEFDFWGKNQSAFEAALDRIHASEVDLQAARLILTSSTVQTYFRLAQAYNQLDLAELILEQHEKVSDLIRQRVVAGIDSEVEMKQAESAIPSARQQVAVMKEAIVITSNQLAALMGKGPDRGRTIVRPQLALDQAIGLPTNVPAELIGHRPDVVAQRWRVEAALRDIDVAQKQFYPNISLLAFAGIQSLGMDKFWKAGSHIAGIGPAVSLPIFDGGRLRSNLRFNNAIYGAAVEQYNQTVADALHDVVNQITSIEWLAEQHTQQILAVSTAQAAFELAMQRYQSGIGNYLQVLFAELQVDQQKRLLIDLNTQVLQLDANLARALGGGILKS